MRSAHASCPILQRALLWTVVLGAVTFFASNATGQSLEDYWRMPDRKSGEAFFLSSETTWDAAWLTPNRVNPQKEVGGDVPTLMRSAKHDWADFHTDGSFELHHLLMETSPLRQATMLQPTPFLEPRISVMESLPRSTQAARLASLFDDPSLDRSVLRQAKLGTESLSVDVVVGEESRPLVTTDVGSLLRKSKSSLSTEVQARTPIVNDPRIRSSRVGSLAASGSYWVPARADLDTAVSKIDSRMINNVIVVPGPYSSVYGPGFGFVDFELLQSPRFSGGKEYHGRSSFDHKSNGNQWLGQQGIWGGGENWGFLANYAHRIGSDYRAGNGLKISSGYESREFTAALGRDFQNDTSIELSLLRLDQTDVEFPGYVFDINALVTDGYEIAYIDNDPGLGDRVENEVWYNRTNFNGDSTNPEKSRQFPFLNFVDFVGSTDADVMSTGYRRAVTWGNDPKSHRITVGHDLRMIKQEVNEVFSTLFPGDPNRVFGQSPMPRSFSVNPGIFAEYYEPFCRDYTFQAGLRADFVQTDVTENPNNLQEVGLSKRSYAETVGTDISQTDRWLWSIYGKLIRQHSRSLTSCIALGYAQRPPTLTELYGAEQLLLLVQNGLNALTGDPRLKSEKLLQIDLSADYVGDYVKGGVRGFSAWGFDYITFENTLVRNFNGEIVQTSLRYVNTDLATLAGFESYAQWMHRSRLNMFATLRYVDGRDRTRNGDFATRQADQFFPSIRAPGLPRGFFSGIAGSGAEPLPGISPLEARVGARLQDRVDDARWNIELSARIVDNQDRVATSLLEFTTPGFTTWDLRAIWQPDRWEGLSVVTGIENFTDKTYREHLDFRSRAGADIFQPGASYYFGADVTY